MSTAAVRARHASPESANALRVLGDACIAPTTSVGELSGSQSNCAAKLSQGLFDRHMPALAEVERYYRLVEPERSLDNI